MQKVRGPSIQANKEEVIKKSSDTLNMIKKIADFFGDYLFGIGSYREAREFEGFAREFCPKRRDLNKRYDLISLEKALESVRNEKVIRFTQIMLTSTGLAAAVAWSYIENLNNKVSLTELMLFEGMIVGFKLGFFGLGKIYENLNSQIKESILEGLAKQRRDLGDGEESLGMREDDSFDNDINK